MCLNYKLLHFDQLNDGPNEEFMIPKRVQKFPFVSKN